MGPLEGRRIAVLRAAAQGGDLARRLREHGAVPVHAPVISIVAPPSYEPLDAALAGAERYDWIVFTSANAADAVADRLAAAGLAPPRTPRLAAIGPATAAVVQARLRPPDLVSPDHHSDGLAGALEPVSGRRILLPSGDLAGPRLADSLARYAEVDVVTAYRTVPASAGIATIARELGRGGLDALVFTSGSTVRFLIRGLSSADTAHLTSAMARPAVVCIGPATARAAGECGLTVDAVADPHTTEGVIDALGRWFERGA